MNYILSDGAAIYAAASAHSHPEAVQVSDHFHLIKGSYEAVRRIIIRLYPSRIEIPSVIETSLEIVALYNTANHARRIRFAKEKRKKV